MMAQVLEIFFFFCTKQGVIRRGIAQNKTELKNVCLKVGSLLPNLCTEGINIQEFIFQNGSFGRKKQVCNRRIHPRQLAELQCTNKMKQYLLLVLLIICVACAEGKYVKYTSHVVAGTGTLLEAHFLLHLQPVETHLSIQPLVPITFGWSMVNCTFWSFQTTFSEK